MFSPQKCREDSQLSPTTAGHITPVWGFSPREFSYFTKMSGCYAVGLSGALFCAGFHPGSLVCCPEKGCEEHHVCRLHCLPPFNGTLSRPGSHSPGLFWIFCLCVCVLSYISLVPNIFIDIFVCCRHLRPPWVNINLHRQPRPRISWPFSGLSPVYPHWSAASRSPPTLTILLWRWAHPLASYVIINTQFATVHSSLFPLHRKHSPTTLAQFLTEEWQW